MKRENGEGERDEDRKEGRQQGGGMQMSLCLGSHDIATVVMLASCESSQHCEFVVTCLLWRLAFLQGC